MILNKLYVNLFIDGNTAVTYDHACNHARRDGWLVVGTINIFDENKNGANLKRIYEALRSHFENIDNVEAPAGGWKLNEQEPFKNEYDLLNRLPNSVVFGDALEL
jgi:hypothetical protein